MIFEIEKNDARKHETPILFEMDPDSIIHTFVSERWNSAAARNVFIVFLSNKKCEHKNVRLKIGCLLSIFSCISHEI